VSSELPFVEAVSSRQAAEHAAWVSERVVAENDLLFGSDDWERFGLRVVDQDGLVIGGVAGHSHWSLGHVDHIWVNPDHRHRGLGARLLSEATQLLHDRGCSAVSLETYSFQNAADFYRSHGFEVVLTIDDHPRGHRRWTLSRSLP
jgi:ribosomal protein S18 acetylase RimI-like enzyme